MSAPIWPQSRNRQKTFRCSNREFMTLSRRQFLMGSAAAGGLLRAQPTNAGTRAIDLHHHFVSPAYVKAVAAKEGHHMAGYTTWFALDRLKVYTPARDIEDMDREGVAASMLSCTSPGVWFGKPEEARALARDERIRR